MDERGLWKLFFVTGSPLVWLAIRREQEKKAVPAFVKETGETAV